MESQSSSSVTELLFPRHALNGRRGHRAASVLARRGLSKPTSQRRESVRGRGDARRQGSPANAKHLIGKDVGDRRSSPSWERLRSGDRSSRTGNRRKGLFLQAFRAQAFLRGCWALRAVCELQSCHIGVMSSVTPPGHHRNARCGLTRPSPTRAQCPACPPRERVSPRRTGPHCRRQSRRSELRAVRSLRELCR